MKPIARCARLPRQYATQLVLGSWIALLAGCANKAAPPLYLWESFPRQQYDALLRDGASTAEQITSMEEHAAKARANDAALPPGFRAHLGMLKLSMGDAEQARQLWMAEQAAFPESVPYMNQLLKRLDAQSAPPLNTKMEKPA